MATHNTASGGGKVASRRAITPNTAAARMVSPRPLGIYPGQSAGGYRNKLMGGQANPPNVHGGITGMPTPKGGSGAKPPAPILGAGGPIGSGVKPRGSGGYSAPKGGTIGRVYPVSGKSGSTYTPPPSGTDSGGTVGGMFDNAASGDLFGRLGLNLPTVLELGALGLAGWLGWKYLARKAGGKRG